MVVALGTALLRTGRERLDALRERAASLERERDAVRREATTQEQLRIARDLHDLVGHGVSSIAVQSSTARVLLDAGDVEAARARVEAVETTSRSAMLEMRQLLGVLRDEHTAALDPSPTLSDLTALVDAARDGGIHPNLVVTGDVSRVPQHVAVTAYRVAQESLTNVIKHAAGAQVDVRVDVREHGLRLTVVDTGGPLRASHKDGGHGLVGIDERVALAGGEVSAGPVERGRGWQVSAVLPFESQQ